MKRLFHLFGQAVLLAITWVAIFEARLPVAAIFRSAVRSRNG